MRENRIIWGFPIYCLKQFLPFSVTLNFFFREKLRGCPLANKRQQMHAPLANGCKLGMEMLLENRRTEAHYQPLDFFIIVSLRTAGSFFK